METLVKLAAPAIGTAAGAFTVVGIIYLGMTLAGLLRGGGGEIRKAVAIIVAGLTCIAFPMPFLRGFRLARKPRTRGAATSGSHHLRRRNQFL